jgi:hypothetical protein
MFVLILQLIQMCINILWHNMFKTSSKTKKCEYVVEQNFQLMSMWQLGVSAIGWYY